MPPPMMAMRGGREVTLRPKGRFQPGWSGNVRYLPLVPTGIPWPVRFRVDAEPPFQAKRERGIILRRQTIVANRQVVGQFGPAGEPRAKRVFNAQADREREQPFVVARAVVEREVELRIANAPPPI